MKKNLSVFLPSYNEQDNLESTVEHVASVLRNTAGKYEIIIVDDGSADATPEVAEKLVQKYPFVRHVRHERNRGYGGALKTGFKEARYELVSFIDSDGQFDFGDIEKFLPYIDEYPVVIGYREKRSDKFHRKLNGFMFNLLIRILFGLNVRDIDCAFKLIRKDVMDRIALDSDGAFVSTELLIRAKRLGCNFKQIGVKHYPRNKGTPTGANPFVIFKAFRDLFLFAIKNK